MLLMHEPESTEESEQVFTPGLAGGCGGGGPSYYMYMYIYIYICIHVYWIPFGDHPLKLERYREDWHGPCARMTRTNREV